MTLHTLFTTSGKEGQMHLPFKAQDAAQKDRPINTASEYTARTGENLKLKDAKDVARIAAESPQAQKRFIELLFQHYTKQPIGAFGVDAADNLLEQFRKNNCNIQKLLIDISVLYANMQDIHTKLAKSEN